MCAGTCRVKLIVESPPTITEDKSHGTNGFSVEAKCLEIREPEFDSKKTGDKAPGIESARKFAVAGLDKATTFIKIGHLGGSSFRKMGVAKAQRQIIALTARTMPELVVNAKVAGR